MNIVVLQHALRQCPADVANAPLHTFAHLIKQAEQLQDFAKQVRDFVDQASELRYTQAAQAARQSQGRSFGVVRIDDHGQTVVCDQRKIVDWNQAQLLELARRIQASGEDPSQYMDVTYKVPESKYNAWPDVLRKQFEDARTERPGKASFKLDTAGEPS